MMTFIDPEGCGRRDIPSHLSYIDEQTVWCVGEVAQFRCESGYQMIGDELSTCREGESWSSEVPSCRSMKNLFHVHLHFLKI